MSRWEIVVRVRPRKPELGEDVICVKDDTKIILTESGKGVYFYKGIYLLI